MQLRQSNLLLVNSPAVNKPTTKDPKVDGHDQEIAAEISPVTFLESIFPKGHKRVRSSPSSHSDDEMEDYTMDVVRAIRANDVAKLRDMMLNQGTSFEACNSNGEYIIHLACRRGNLETVQFLVQEAGVSTSVRDDMGRSILHDVCWKSSPDTALMDLLLNFVSPELLLAQDARGHSPFDYARKTHWSQWNAFLKQRQDDISRRVAFLASQ